ncbi:MAG: cupredoxin family copper-binding protein [Pseudonocardia sp.]|nr:cupredoxin family copper-binding protein [Pseudonocardia sp.]
MRLPRLLFAVATSATLLFAGHDTAANADQPAVTAAPTTAMADMADMASKIAAPGPADAPVATNAVTIQNFAYSPATVTVKAGTTVTWTNKDQDPHTVTSMNGGPLQSPTLNTGDSFRYTFKTPGRFEYLCTIHPFMTATVVVTP